MRAVLAEDGRVCYVGDEDTLECGMSEIQFSYRSFVLLAREYEGLQRRAQCIADLLRSIHSRCKEFLSDCTCGGRPEVLSCYGSLVCDQCGEHYSNNPGEAFKACDSPVVQWERKQESWEEFDPED